MAPPRRHLPPPRHEHDADDAARAQTGRHAEQRADPLDDPQALWRLWRQAYQAVTGDVVAHVIEATGLSDPDIAVLLRLRHHGGRCRHAELAHELDWHRSRLWHHTSRMIERGLVARQGDSTHTDVVLTRTGRRRIAAAEPVHAAAAQARLADPLTRRQRTALVTALRRLSAPPAPEETP